MKTISYVLFSILLLASTACQKHQESATILVEEPSSLQVSIHEIDLDVSEDGFNNKALDGPVGEPVDKSDFYFYLAASEETNWKQVSTIEAGSDLILFPNLNKGEKYDIYASTIPYSSSFESIGDFSFPTQEVAGEFYKGKATTADLEKGKNAISVPVSLQVFSFDIRFKEGVKDELCSQLYITDSNEPYYFSYKQKEKETTITWTLLKDKEFISKEVFALPADGDIMVSLYTKNYEGSKILIKSTMIASPEAGKRYIVSPSTKLSELSPDISIDLDWSESEETIDF